MKDIQCSNVVDTIRKLVTKSLKDIHPVLNNILYECFINTWNQNLIHGFDDVMQ